MTRDELRAALAGFPPGSREDAAARGVFVARIDAWPSDTSPAAQLVDDLDRILGNVWFSEPATHERVGRAIEAFAATVRQIGGMTMNERLFVLGLVDLWDTSSEQERAALRSKVSGS